MDLRCRDAEGFGGRAQKRDSPTEKYRDCGKMNWASFYIYSFFQAERNNCCDWWFCPKAGHTKFLMGLKQEGNGLGWGRKSCQGEFGRRFGIFGWIPEGKGFFSLLLPAAPRSHRWKNLWIQAILPQEKISRCFNSQGMVRSYGRVGKKTKINQGQKKKKKSDQKEKHREKCFAACKSKQPLGEEQLDLSLFWR